MHVPKRTYQSLLYIEGTVQYSRIKIRVYNTMYTLVKTMGRKRGERALMDIIDATNVTLLDLSQQYTDIYFIVQGQYDSKPKCLFFNDLPIEAQVSLTTIVDWLAEMGTGTIDISSIIPQHLRGEVYYWDADSWGFDYKPYKVGYHPRARIADEDKRDLLLSRKSTDMSNAGKHSLISINGFFHYHEYDDSGWMLLDGNQTKMKNYNSTHIGILDFTQVGEVVLKKITPEMIREPTEACPLHDNCYIDVGTHLSNKTVGIVIGGYFHLLDNTYKHISDSTIKIDFNNMQLETMYYQMKKYIDVSSLPLTDFGDDRVIGFEFYHDRYIRALLSLPQSFLVVIHNPHVTVREVQIGHTGIPKRYETALPPIYPLRIGEGRYPAYKAIKELDKWSIAIDDDILPLQVRYQKPTEEYYLIHDRHYPTSGQVYATAHLVRIISDKDLGLKEIDPYFNDVTRTIGSLQPFMLKTDNITSFYHTDAVDEYYLPKKIIDEDFDNNVYYSTSSVQYVPET